MLAKLVCCLVSVKPRHSREERAIRLAGGHVSWDILIVCWCTWLHPWAGGPKLLLESKTSKPWGASQWASFLHDFWPPLLLELLLRLHSVWTKSYFWLQCLSEQSTTVIYCHQNFASLPTLHTNWTFRIENFNSQACLTICRLDKTSKLSNEQGGNVERKPCLHASHVRAHASHARKGFCLEEERRQWPMEKYNLFDL